MVGSEESIAEENKPKVFNRCSREDHPPMQETAGMGFSLRVDKRLVELHGGRIGFTNWLGQESNFAFVIRVALPR